MLVTAIALLGPLVFGVKSFAVLSGSMEPTVSTGSMIYVKPAAPEEIEVRDIITFTLADDNFATHRVMEKRDAERVFITKGDANDVEDNPVEYERIIGKMIFHLPLVGFFVTTINSSAGILIGAGVLIILVISTFLPMIFSEKDKAASPNKDSA